MNVDPLAIDLPDWALPLEDATRRISAVEDRMRFVIGLARSNVDQGSGGPFGAAVFTMDEGRLVAIGVNSVMRLGNSVMHAEMMAIMRAERAIGSFTLNPAGGAGHELVTSCEPCAMCLGGALWSGIRRLVCGAGADAARGIGFDEGPVFPDSYRHLARAGTEVVRNVLADEAAAVIRRYRASGGPIYNG
jgi:tRNA(Arg) A34 adenosine deaminase TadA